MERTGDKRYICSFVKKVGNELKPNVVVIAAPNNIVARAKLCEQYGVLNIQINIDRLRLNEEEGIKDIRLSETNTYVGGARDGDLSDDS